MGTFPNIATQFLPGNPGNPDATGRPKGSKNFSTLIKAMVEDDDYKIKLEEGKWLKKPGKAIVQAMTIKAYKGDVQAATWLAKYGYGDKTDITSNGETITHNPSDSLALAQGFAAYLLQQTKANVIEGTVVTPTTPSDVPPDQKSIQSTTQAN